MSARWRPVVILVAALAGASALAWSAEGDAEDDVGVFPIDVAVATDDGTPVQDEAWIDDETRACGSACTGETSRTRAGGT
jgi:hypothetical protein